MENLGHVQNVQEAVGLAQPRDQEHGLTAHEVEFAGANNSRRQLLELSDMHFGWVQCRTLLVLSVALVGSKQPENTVLHVLSELLIVLKVPVGLLLNSVAVHRATQNHHLGHDVAALILDHVVDTAQTNPSAALVPCDHNLLGIDAEVSCILVNVIEHVHEVALSCWSCVLRGQPVVHVEYGALVLVGPPHHQLIVALS